MNIPKSLQTISGRRLLISVLMATMAVIATVAFLTYRSYQRAAAELVLQRDGQVAQLSAARLSAELDNFSGILVDFARSSSLFSGDTEELETALEAAGPRLTVFDGGVFLLDNHGVVVATEPNRPDIIGLDMSKREYFRTLLSQSSPFISDSVADGPNGEQVIAISVPIQGPQGEFAGALVGFFNLGEEISSSFYASLVRLRLGQTGSTYLFDGQARILFDTGSDRVGHFLTTQQLAQISALRQSGPTRTVDEAGNEIVAALAPVPDTDWTLVIEDDWKILTSSTRRYSNIFFLSLGLGLILPPISVAVLARQRRVRELLSDQNKSDDHLPTLIQHAILPAALPMLPGWDLAVRQSKEGDGHLSFYDASILADGRLLVALGETNSATLEAALALSQTHAIMRAAAEQDTASKETLGQCNLLLSRTTNRVTIKSIYLTLDPIDGTYQFCSAGQGPPILTDHFSTWQDWSTGPSDQIGESIEPHFVSGKGRLERGQILLLASQHAWEAEAPNGEVFCDEVVIDILERSPANVSRLADALMAEYRSFRQSLHYATPPMILLLVQRIENGQVAE